MKSAAVRLRQSRGAELNLMCLMARLTSSEEALSEARGVVASRIDWPLFLGAVERNFVAPLVLRNLKALTHQVPGKVLDTLRVRAKITAFKSEKFAAELARLAAVIEREGIELIHYKGALSALQLYGAITLRNFNDLDFLVRRRDLRRLVNLLDSEGYRNSETLTSEQFEHYVREFKEFLFTRGEISIEPHWSLAGRRYPFDIDYEGFWERATRIDLKDTSLRALGAEDCLLVLCLVGAKGRWKRLQMVTDIAACLQRFPNLDWPKVRAMASDTGTLRILTLGCYLARELSGAVLPPSAGEWKFGRTVEGVARQVTATLFVPRRPPKFLPDSPSVFSPLLFRQRESVRHRWHYLWHTATTPEPIHLRRVPLPRAAFPLYRLVVPLHDFVVYPAWQIGKSMMSRRTSL